MTKKFVNALSKDGCAVGRSRFLIPAIDGTDQFEELGTGKRHSSGYLVYTGKDLSSADVAMKFSGQNPHSDVFHRLIESYLSEIAKFKVGNVVGLERVAEDEVRLKLISQMPKQKPGVNTSHP